MVALSCHAPFKRSFLWSVYFDKNILRIFNLVFIIRYYCNISWKLITFDKLSYKYWMVGCPIYSPIYGMKGYYIVSLNHTFYILDELPSNIGYIIHTTSSNELLDNDIIVHRTIKLKITSSSIILSNVQYTLGFPLSNPEH